jgi:hypothetical protein
MTTRTTEKIITFHRPFCLEGVDGVLPPADYRVLTDEEVIEGLAFVAYHRGCDQHLRTGAIWVRSRDGANRSPGSPSGAGTRRADVQC